MEVVQCNQSQPQDFFRFDEMTNIAACEITAGRTNAVFFDRFFVEGTLESGRVAVAVGGSQRNPFVSFHNIFGNALSVGVAGPNGVFGLGNLLLGGRTKPSGRLGGILFDTLT